MRVLHIITGLSQGGAEAVLQLLVAATVAGDCETVVVSLSGEGIYGEKLRKCGARVEALNMPRGRLTWSGIQRLRRICLEVRPDVVQTWMYHANLIGGLVARFTGIPALVWGIHSSSPGIGAQNMLTGVIAQVCGSLSTWLPAAIVCCSRHAARVHRDLGYAERKIVIIPNGYDLDLFQPDEEARLKVREEWGIPAEVSLLGMVGRWHPVKDHSNLLQALGRLAIRQVAFRCVLVGTEISGENSELTDLINRYGLAARLILAGPRDDMPSVMNALDLHVLSSISEAFPNVVAEAMACGTPCVVTDVGDAALIVGETGWIAPPNNPEALAESIDFALTSIQKLGRENLGKRVRARIKENFSTEQMVAGYMKCWTTVAR